MCRLGTPVLSVVLASSPGAGWELLSGTRWHSDLYRNVSGQSAARCDNDGLFRDTVLRYDVWQNP